MNPNLDMSASLSLPLTWENLECEESFPLATQKNNIVPDTQGSDKSSKASCAASTVQLPARGSPIPESTGT